MYLAMKNANAWFYNTILKTGSSVHCKSIITVVQICYSQWVIVVTYFQRTYLDIMLNNYNV